MTTPKIKSEEWKEENCYTGIGEDTSWRNQYPLSTFAGETRKELTAFIESIIKEREEEVRAEYKQFILNVLDGVDISDGKCNTKAIRLAIESRV